MSLQTQVATLRQSVGSSRHSESVASATSSAKGIEINRVDLTKFGLAGSSLVHRCLGMKQMYSSGINDARFDCVGENQLSLVDSGGNDFVLVDQTVTAENPVVLMDPIRINSSLLIQFAPNPCLTRSDCGAGGPDRFVTGALDMATSEYRALHNYPESGAMFWNQTGDKAVVVKKMCRGAGCAVAPLYGYDLLKDTFVSQTTETGADEWTATDVNGKMLPYWSEVTWLDATHFADDLVQPDKTVKTLKLTFK